MLRGVRYDGNGGGSDGVIVIVIMIFVLIHLVNHVNGIGRGGTW